MSLGSEVYGFVRALAGLRVSEREPGCWCLSYVSFLSEDEREELLAFLAARSKAMAAGTPYPDRGVQQGIAWRILSGDPATWDLPGEGHWTLLFWASETVPSVILPDVDLYDAVRDDAVRDECQILKYVLATHNADVLISAGPDDLDWTVVVRSDSLPPAAFRGTGDFMATPNDPAGLNRVILTVLAILVLVLLVVGWFRWFGR